MPNWDLIKKEWETSNITLKDLAEKHGVKLGTLKSRKSREKWSRDGPEKDATKNKKVATPKKEKVATQATSKKSADDSKASSNAKSEGRRNRSGNPNPKNQFTKRNTAALKHGFFSKYIPQETLEIMGAMEKDPADLIWDQIMIQYVAIIRAQQIMYVESKDETVKELKKLRVETVQGPDGEVQVPTEKEYEIQFAWDRYANFMNAQSRAMSEFRSLVKQFNDLAFEDDERRLKLEYMQAQIHKTKAETDKITSANESDTPPIINIVDEWSDSDE